MRQIPQLDYRKTPFIIIWEATQACDLACRHCRASAQPNHDPAELTTAEGENLLKQAADLGTPIFIISGGDPLKRADLFHLVRYGADLGMRMATIPAATPLLTEDVVRRLKDSGLSQMALSLDYPRAELHDAFRMVPGAFAKTMQAIEWAHKHDLALQINTTLCGESEPYLEEMIELVGKLGIVFWEVFFLVPMGRGASLTGLTPDQCEEIFEVLYRLQKESRFLVKVTEAPHYRRYVAQREAEEGGRASSTAGMAGMPGARRPVTGLPAQLIRTEGPGHSIGLATRGVNSGNGFMFISHRGEAFPSGFLPSSAGSLREKSLEWLYRDSEIFRKMRRPEDLLGVCGHCEYNAICGGSRSRAYALTGNVLAGDPWCSYLPARPRTEWIPPPPPA